MKDYTLDEHEYNLIIFAIDAQLEENERLFEMINQIPMNDVKKYELVNLYNDPLFLYNEKYLQLKKKLQLMDSLR